MEKKIIDTIPPYIVEVVKDKKIVLMGFGAGPGFVAQKTEQPDPPVDFSSGINWLERYRHSFRRARLEFQGGGRLWFNGPCFDRYDVKN